jgi:hypothetical protein
MLPRMTRVAVVVVYMSRTVVLYRVKYIREGHHMTWLTYGMFSELPWPNWIVNRNRGFVSARIRGSVGRALTELYDKSRHSF